MPHCDMSWCFQQTGPAILQSYFLILSSVQCTTFDEEIEEIEEKEVSKSEPRFIISGKTVGK